VSIDLAPKAKEGRAIYVLIPLLAVNLVLLSMQIEDPLGTLLFKRWILAAEEPFIKASSAVSGGIQRIWTGYFWLHGAREENRQLQAKVRDLTLRVETLEQAQKENAQLQRLLAYSGSLPYRSTTAKVVGRTPDFMSRTVLVDQGSASGIAVDDAVLTTAGVVGRVVLVSRYHSQVQLITNADASTGVMMEGTRTPGVLKGSGDAALNLDYVSNTEQVNPGDLVISSGLDGIYPKGIPVGKVLASRKGSSVFRSIQVEPTADLLHLEEVLVLSKELKPGNGGSVKGR
jgi:rod shape-determining protein MreC